MAIRMIVLSLVALWSVQQSLCAITEIKKFNKKPTNYVEVTFEDDQPTFTPQQAAFHQVSVSFFLDGVLIKSFG